MSVVTDHVGFVVGEHDAVDHFVDRGRSLADALGEFEHRADRHRAARDGEHHVLQTVLDALRNVDFPFAREKLDRSHFTHVDAHGVRRAAEFAVDRRKGGFGLLLDVVLAHHGGVALHEKLVLVGRTFVHLNVEGRHHAHDRFDRVVVDEAGRNVVVDFGVGDVAALLTHADELEELRAAVFGRLLFRAVALGENVSDITVLAVFCLAAALAGVGFVFGEFRNVGNVLGVLFVAVVFVDHVDVGVVGSGVKVVLALVVIGLGLLRALLAALLRSGLGLGNLLRARLARGLRLLFFGFGGRFFGRGRFLSGGFGRNGLGFGHLLRLAAASGFGGFFGRRFNRQGQPGRLFDRLRLGLRATNTLFGRLRVVFGRSRLHGVLFGLLRCHAFPHFCKVDAAPYSPSHQENPWPRSKRAFGAYLKNCAIRIRIAGHTA